MALVCILAAFILLSLSKIISLLAAMQRRHLGLPLSISDINTLIKYSPQYAVISDQLEIYPRQEAEYKLIQIDGTCYIRALVFYSYMDHVGYEYTFIFPNREPVQLLRQDQYEQGVDAFEHKGEVFVSLDRLQLIAHKDGDQLNILYSSINT